MNKKIFFVLLLFTLALAAVFFLWPKKAIKDNTSLPDESRFQKSILGTGLDEPMELTVLPDSNVLFIERKGAVKLYSQDKNEITTVAVLPVFHDLEDGLLGLVLDPDFSKNHFLYLFYSPVGETPMQRVSRFVFANNTLDIASEKILIEIPTQRKECCHSAGSLAFGPNHTLFIAIGDNTNPHNPGYYNSIDERVGREYWDAQRTAANTNDYRGKILRIKPEADGTYSIPDGNLFPKDGSQGKPEIYAMGCRNPYRISVDQKTNYLYWGDVGQNTENNPARGPISYDEFHQAKKAGFFGWPYFAGDNQPYADFDFETEKIGSFFDVAHPVNDSRNNTGMKDLPPAQSAFIWYSYDSSAVFKNLGTGGKSPIIGPVYYTDQYPEVKDGKKSRKFPSYYNGKLFIAEWMRDWINVVTMDEHGNLKDIERFMPSSQFVHPIELEFGPDGALYVLEYGTFWFAQNNDAKLVRIDYNDGNRAPVAIAQADKIAGAIPFTAKLSAAKSYDYDKDNTLTFSWTLDEKNGITAEGKTITHRFEKPGVYPVTLKVTDDAGESSITHLTLYAGNETPEITLQTPAGFNQSFYWPGKSFSYTVRVADKEDGQTENGTIAPADVFTSLQYLEHDAPLKQQTENVSTAFIGGLELINQNDCKACHHVKEKSVGPSYEKIATRYHADKNALDVLSSKIIKGGNGSWGETAMSAHPQLKKNEAEEMVRYILSLSDNAKSLPLQGSFTPTARQQGRYVLHVRYTDKGGNGLPSQTTEKNFIIRPAKLNAILCDEDNDVSKFNDEVVRFTKSGSYIAFKDIDITSLNKVTFTISSRIPANIELRLDSVNGPMWGKALLKPTITGEQKSDASQKFVETEAPGIPLGKNSGTHTVYIIYRDAEGSEADMWTNLNLYSIRFD